MPRKARKKTRRRYTEKGKQSLLAKYHDLRNSSTTAEKAAKKVGVTYVTLLKWEKAAGKPPKAAKKRATRAALKKAVVVPKGKKKRGRKTGITKIGGLTLVTPAGFRLEGISTKELIRVLKELK